MAEISAVAAAVKPVETLLVVDAMTGQESVTVAQAFAAAVPVTGLVLTKIDGDARGGAALSVVSVVGAPIAFVGAGERIEDIEAFHADRFVSRLLGMGDVLSLIEKAEDAIDENEAEQLEEKIRKGGFSLDDFRSQLKTLRKMGPLEHILGMLPGMGNLKQIADQKPDERQLTRIEAIIGSMTPEERKYAGVIDGSRRKRIARGSGTSVEDVNRLLKQFNEMQRMLKMVGEATGQTIAAPPKKKKKKSPFSLMR
jgi:signal recognition particle subunit SRP54